MEPSSSDDGCLPQARTWRRRTFPPPPPTLPMRRLRHIASPSRKPPPRNTTYLWLSESPTRYAPPRPLGPRRPPQGANKDRTAAPPSHPLFPPHTAPPRRPRCVQPPAAPLFSPRAHPRARRPNVCGLAGGLAACPRRPAPAATPTAVACARAHTRAPCPAQTATPTAHHQITRALLAKPGAPRAPTAAHRPPPRLPAPRPAPLAHVRPPPLRPSQVLATAWCAVVRLARRAQIWPVLTSVTRQETPSRGGDAPPGGRASTPAPSPRAPAANAPPPRMRLP